MDKTRAGRDTRCPYLKIKLTKLPLNSSLDELPPPHFILYDINLYYNIYTNTNLRIFVCKTHTNSEQASINRERIETIASSAQLTCSLIFNFDWSEKVFLSNF